MTTILNKFRLINNKFLLKNCLTTLIRGQAAGYLSLAEVGKLEDLKKNYEPGQLFLHKVFGYRGVILFPWRATIFDNDQSTRRTTKVSDENGVDYNYYGKEIKGREETYYQVLMDFRDSPFVRAQTESVTFLSSGKNSRQLCSIPYMDYVSHADVLPYLNTTELKTPIENELFGRFFDGEVDDNSKFKPKDTLLAWKENNHEWLALSDVYKQTTNNIQVTAIPFFIGIRYSQNTTNYWWRYSIRIENLGKECVRIRERHWTISSPLGSIESMIGTGIGGTEPILSPKHQPAFQYSSHVNIQSSPTGTMTGFFKIEKEDGDCFICKIPSFPLKSKTTEQSTQS